MTFQLSQIKTKPASPRTCFHNEPPRKLLKGLLRELRFLPTLAGILRRKSRTNAQQIPFLWTNRLIGGSISKKLRLRDKTLYFMNISGTPILWYNMVRYLNHTDIVSSENHGETLTSSESSGRSLFVQKILPPWTWQVLCVTSLKAKRKTLASPSALYHTKFRRRGSMISQNRVIWKSPDRKSPKLSIYR